MMFEEYVIGDLYAWNLIHKMRTPQLNNHGVGMCRMDIDRGWMTCDMYLIHFNLTIPSGGRQFRFMIRNSANNFGILRQVSRWDTSWTGTGHDTTGTTDPRISSSTGTGQKNYWGTIIINQLGEFISYQFSCGSREHATGHDGHIYGTGRLDIVNARDINAFLLLNNETVDGNWTGVIELYGLSPRGIL